MLHGLSLPAYLAIARMVARTTPFDVDLALLLVDEVARELRLKPEAPRAATPPEPGLPNPGDDGTRAGSARQGIAVVIAEIDRRLGAAPAGAYAPIR